MPARKSNSTSASEIIRRKLFADDSETSRLIRDERTNAKVAQMIQERRIDAGLTQKELAELIGSTQSVISRLEDADYDGHSLTMLNRIADALKHRLEIKLKPKNALPPDRDEQTRAAVFREFLQKLRRSRGLSVEQMAKKLQIDSQELLAAEQTLDYRPPARLLYAISEMADVPYRSIAMLAGAVKEMPPQVRRELSRFAAKSESFHKLTEEEKDQLDSLVSALKAETSARKS